MLAIDASSQEAITQSTVDTQRKIPTILVVEDDFDTRELLKLMLETEGYTVVTAENGATALRSLDEIKPNLIVTDLMMPLVSGEAIIRALRGRSAFASTPIVVLTAFKGAFGSAAMMAGATEVLGKPQDLPRLAETIHRLLRNGARS